MFFYIFPQTPTRHEEARDLYLDMMEDGVNHDIYTYKISFQGLSSKSMNYRLETSRRSVEDVMMYFETARSMGFTLTREMYSRLIHTLAGQAGRSYWPLM